MITFKEICWNSELFDCVKALLESSFPVEERRDMDAFVQVARLDSRFSVFGGEAEGRLAGFISSWDFGEFAYVEHFAVAHAMRNHGYGSQLLKAWLAACGGKPVVLEVEPPADVLTRRRVGFYERNGFVLHGGFDYMQPPYRDGDGELPLKLMTCGDFNLPLDAVAATIRSEVYDKPRRGAWGVAAQ